MRTAVGLGGVVILSVFALGCAGTHGNKRVMPDPLQVIKIDSSAPDYIMLRNAGREPIDLRVYQFVEDTNTYIPDSDDQRRVMIEPGEIQRIFFLSRKASVTERSEWVNWIGIHHPNALVCDEFGLSTGERIAIWHLGKGRRLKLLRVP